MRPRDLPGKTRRRMAAEELADLDRYDAGLKSMKAELKAAVEAMRCLRRRLSDVVYRQLAADARTLAAQGAGPGGHSGAA